MSVLFKPPRDIQDLALAFSETVAHLHQLAGAARLIVDIDDQGVRRFQRAG
jgi:hypothetical protein